MALADMGTYLPQNVRFHDIIVGYADNQILLAIYGRLINEMHLMRRHEMVKSQGKAVSAVEHTAVVDALDSQFEPGVSAAIEAHVMGGRRRLLGILGFLDGSPDRSSLQRA